MCVYLVGILKPYYKSHYLVHIHVLHVCIFTLHLSKSVNLDLHSKGKILMYNEFTNVHNL